LLAKIMVFHQKNTIFAKNFETNNKLWN